MTQIPKGLILNTMMKNIFKVCHIMAIAHHSYAKQDKKRLQKEKSTVLRTSAGGDNHHPMAYMIEAQTQMSP